MTANDRLAKTIAMGRTRYILLFGVLGWGLLTAALFTVWIYFRMGPLNLVKLVLPFILFPIGGYFWGAFMWSTMKKRFDRSTSP